MRNQEWSYSETWKPEAPPAQFHKFPGAPLCAYQPQLYNLHQDPKESTDVAEKFPNVAQQMSAKLKQYIASGDGVTLGSFSAQPTLDTAPGLYAK